MQKITQGDCRLAKVVRAFFFRVEVEDAKVWLI
jgi:hypothetical protein